MIAVCIATTPPTKKDINETRPLFIVGQGWSGSSAIVDYLRKSSNLCRTTIQMQQKSKKAEEILRSELQRDPTNREIAKKLGMSLEEYEEWEIAFNANVHQSLDSVYDEYSIWFASKESSPEEALSNSQLKNTLKDALSCLPKK